jgi:hypothetical protein
MTVTMPTNTIPNSQPAKPEQPRPQAQEDLAGLRRKLRQRGLSGSAWSARATEPGIESENGSGTEAAFPQLICEGRVLALKAGGAGGAPQSSSTWKGSELHPLS